MRGYGVFTTFEEREECFDRLCNQAANATDLDTKLGDRMRAKIIELIKVNREFDDLLDSLADKSSGSHR